MAGIGPLACAVFWLVVGLVVLTGGAGRTRRWLDRHPVVASAALEPGAPLPKVARVYGRTAPGRGGPVVAPLSGVAGVWFRTEILVSWGDASDARTVWEQSAGDPFEVRDGSGSVAVSARMLESSSAFAGLPSPLRVPVDETTGDWRRPRPRLQQLIDQGAIAASKLKYARTVMVWEQVLELDVPIQLIGRPELADSRVLLAPPRSGRCLATSAGPELTRQAVVEDHPVLRRCAAWAILIGLVLLPVCFAIASAIGA